MSGIYLTKINSDNQHMDGYGLFLSVFDLIVLSAFSPLFAATATISTRLAEYNQHPTAENHIRLLSAFTNSIGYAAFVAIPIASTALFFSEFWLEKIGKPLGYRDPAVIRIASEILRPLSALIPFVMSGAIARMAIRSAKLDHIFRPAIAIMITGLLLAKIFSAGWLGLPAVLFFFILEAATACSYYLGTCTK